MRMLVGTGLFEVGGLAITRGSPTPARTCINLESFAVTVVRLSCFFTIPCPRPLFSMCWSGAIAADNPTTKIIHTARASLTLSMWALGTVDGCLEPRSKHGTDSQSGRALLRSAQPRGWINISANEHLNHCSQRRHIIARQPVAPCHLVLN